MATSVNAAAALRKRGSCKRRRRPAAVSPASQKSPVGAPTPIAAPAAPQTATSPAPTTARPSAFRDWSFSSHAPTTCHGHAHAGARGAQRGDDYGFLPFGLAAMSDTAFDAASTTDIDFDDLNDDELEVAAQPSSSSNSSRSAFSLALAEPAQALVVARAAPATYLPPLTLEPPPCSQSAMVVWRPQRLRVGTAPALQPVAMNRAASSRRQRHQEGDFSRDHHSSTTTTSPPKPARGIRARSLYADDGDDYGDDVCHVPLNGNSAPGTSVVIEELPDVDEKLVYGSHGGSPTIELLGTRLRLNTATSAFAAAASGAAGVGAGATAGAGAGAGAGSGFDTSHNNMFGFGMSSAPVSPASSMRSSTVHSASSSMPTAFTTSWDATTAPAPQANTASTANPFNPWSHAAAAPATCAAAASSSSSLFAGFGGAHSATTADGDITMF